jgi:hypothetical protein
MLAQFARLAKVRKHPVFMRLAARFILASVRMRSHPFIGSIVPTASPDFRPLQFIS